MIRLAVVFSLVLFSCSQKKSPPGFLGIEKMQSVYWDYMRADAFANEYIRIDTTKNVEVESARLQQKVFKLHKVSRESFYSSYDYYLKNPPLLKQMLDTMLVRQPKLHEEQKKIKQKIDSLSIQ